MLRTVVFATALLASVPTADAQILVRRLATNGTVIDTVQYTTAAPISVMATGGVGTIQVCALGDANLPSLSIVAASGSAGLPVDLYIGPVPAIPSSRAPVNWAGLEPSERAIGLDAVVRGDLTGPVWTKRIALLRIDGSIAPGGEVTANDDPADTTESTIRVAGSVNAAITLNDGTLRELFVGQGLNADVLVPTTVAQPWFQGRAGWISEIRAPGGIGDTTPGAATVRIRATRGIREITAPRIKARIETSTGVMGAITCAGSFRGSIVAGGELGPAAPVIQGGRIPPTGIRVDGDFDGIISVANALFLPIRVGSVVAPSDPAHAGLPWLRVGSIANPNVGT